MKKVLSICASIALVALLASCNRSVLVVETDPLQGSWTLTDAARKDASGWHSLNTGLEGGVFRFYSDGTADYADNLGTMTGTWFTRVSLSGYYDQYGDFYTDSHQSLGIHLTDYSTHSTMDLSFDDISFSGNGFTATIWNGNYLDRYHFARW